MPSFFTTFIPFVVIELQRHCNPFLLTLKQTCLLVNQSMCSPGGYSGFQVTGMIEWGQKSNPPKISVPKCNPPKNPMPNFRAIKFPESIKWYNYNESSDCFEYPKNHCHLKSGVPLLGHLLSYKCSICLYVVNAIMLVVLISCLLQMCGTLTEK